MALTTEEKLQRIKAIAELVESLRDSEPHAVDVILKALDRIKDVVSKLKR